MKFETAMKLLDLGLSKEFVASIESEEQAKRILIRIKGYC